MKELFSKWQESRSFNAFVKDGIVAPDCYESPHILFVLRDMNCRTERNLCDDLARDGSGGKTWSNVGRWIKALLDGEQEYPFDMSSEKRAEQLKRVAVMNLKKEGGGSRAVGKEILKSVMADRGFIYDEICLCNPDIIICCGLSAKGILGNACLLKDYVLPNTTKWKSFASNSLNREWWFYNTEINGKEVPVISFCHPQVSSLSKVRGHSDLLIPLYEDMLYIRERFIEKK